MSINGPPGCYRCEQPIAKGGEVLLNKELFHPGCAVEVAKEKKHGRKTDGTRRGEKGHEARTVARADTTGD
jgi:hypothetical protein